VKGPEEGCRKENQLRKAKAIDTPFQDTSNGRAAEKTDRVQKPKGWPRAGGINKWGIVSAAYNVCFKQKRFFQSKGLMVPCRAASRTGEHHRGRLDQHKGLKVGTIKTPEMNKKRAKIAKVRYLSRKPPFRGGTRPRGIRKIFWHAGPNRNHKVKGEKKSTEKPGGKQNIPGARGWDRSKFLPSLSEKEFLRRIAFKGNMVARGARQ